MFYAQNWKFTNITSSYDISLLNFYSCSFNKQGCRYFHHVFCAFRSSWSDTRSSNLPAPATTLLPPIKCAVRTQTGFAKRKKKGSCLVQSYSDFESKKLYNSGPKSKPILITYEVHSGPSHWCARRCCKCKIVPSELVNFNYADTNKFIADNRNTTSDDVQLEILVFSCISKDLETSSKILQIFVFFKRLTL